MGNLASNNIAILKEYYRYDAFGTPTIYNAAGTVLTSSAIGNRILFTGREYNSQFGFYEYRARAYHPGLGRFMSEDPKGFDAGDYNWFRYCLNDPWDLTDPMGLAPQTVDSDIDSFSAYAAIQCLFASENNFDGGGKGLERMTVNSCVGGDLKQSDMSVGRLNPATNGQITDPPPHQGDAVSSSHNHTNRTPISRHDREVTSDDTGKPAYVAVRDSKGRIALQRHRPSDTKAKRDLHQDSANEQLDPKAVNELIKSQGNGDVSGKWKPIDPKKLDKNQL
jgi:RHS repeat-associated protein